ncbi:vomeronasal type-2 receptor 116-like, partial [Rattus rattus]|uniref:vomeronasal type-2 receptor 116-like n=1 Tax=Rattus rattus TaxID=10117 RepID=UPI0013F36D20
MADNVWKDGDMLISVFLPMYSYLTAQHTEGPDSITVSCSVFKLYPNKYQHVLALVFAIEEINRNPHLLPNISIGYSVYNSEPNFAKTLFNTIKYLTGMDEAIPNYTFRGEMNTLAVITGTTWEISYQIGRFLVLYKYPQLTIGPFDPMLSDDIKFPSLCQMAPKDTTLARGMVSLMVHFRWTWVGLVISENEKGIGFLSDLRREMEKNNVCAAFVQMIRVNFTFHLSDSFIYHSPIMREMANVVIVFGDTESSVGTVFMRWEHIFPWKVWITTSQWDVTSSMRHFILDSFHGTLTFSQHHPDISAFKDFIKNVKPFNYPDDAFLSEIWTLYFNCPVSGHSCKTRKNCSSKGSLALLPWDRFDVKLSEGSYHIYNTVYAVAHSLHEMLLKDVDMKPVDSNKGQFIHPWQLHRFVKSIQFNNPVGEKVDMRQREKSDAQYDILNFWNFPQGLGHKMHVGAYFPYSPHDNQLSLSEDIIEWGTGVKQTPISVCSVSCSPGSRKFPQENKAACCFDCKPCFGNEISNQTDMDQCVKCPGDQYANKEKNHCLKKTVTFLAFEDPLGMALAFLALCFSVLTALVFWVFLKHRDTPIVKANNRTLSYTLLISLIFCFLCSLLFIGHPNTATCIMQQIIFGFAFTVSVTTVLSKTITVVLAFKITTPGRRMRGLLVSGAPNYVIPVCTLIQIILCGVWLGTSPPFVERDLHTEYGHILIICNKGSVIAFYCALGYLGALALISFTVAFLARNLPDTFNEAKYLTFSMLVFCSVWVTFLPVYHSTKGKVMVSVEVFSILSSSAGLLVCIFFPKCYIILRKPDKNNSLKEIE